jgi:hypothetical protein
LPFAVSGNRGLRCDRLRRSPRRCKTPTPTPTPTRPPSGPCMIPFSVPSDLSPATRGAPWGEEKLRGRCPPARRWWDERRGEEEREVGVASPLCRVAAARLRELPRPHVPFPWVAPVSGTRGAGPAAAGRTRVSTTRGGWHIYWLRGRPGSRVARESVGVSGDDGEWHESVAAWEEVGSPAADRSWWASVLLGLVGW